MSSLDIGQAGLLQRFPSPSHPQYSIVFLYVVSIHHRKRTTVESLVFLIQWVAMYRCDDVLFLNTESVHAFSSVCQFLVNPRIFRKRSNDAHVQETLF
jgi:hypothetical protein